MLVYQRVNLFFKTQHHMIWLEIHAMMCFSLSCLAVSGIDAQFPSQCVQRTDATPKKDPTSEASNFHGHQYTPKFDGWLIIIFPVGTATWTVYHIPHTNVIMTQGGIFDCQFHGEKCDPVKSSSPGTLNLTKVGVLFDNVFMVRYGPIKTLETSNLPWFEGSKDRRGGHCGAGVKLWRRKEMLK